MHRSPSWAVRSRRCVCRSNLLKKILESAEQQEKAYQLQEGEAQRAMTNAERSLGQVQLELTRRQEALTTLRQRIEDDFGLVQFDYRENVSGPVPLPLDGMVEQLPVVTSLPLELEEQLARQRSQVRRMGAVNPEAAVGIREPSHSDTDL